MQNAKEQYSVRFKRVTKKGFRHYKILALQLVCLTWGRKDSWLSMMTPRYMNWDLGITRVLSNIIAGAIKMKNDWG